MGHTRLRVFLTNFQSRAEYQLTKEKSSLLVAGLMLALLGPSCKRSNVAPSGELVPWKSGVVAVFDYCLHPGTYDNRIEWVNGEGNRKLLLRVGDTVPNISVSEGGDLIAIFHREKEGKAVWVRAMWHEPDSGPALDEHEEYPR